MLEKLKTLKTILPAKEFILTGSTALAYHGLAELTASKDLDIILVEPADSAKEILERLQKENPNPKFTGKGTLAYSFIYEGVKVDIWVAKVDAENLLSTPDGIKVSCIKSIVQAKKSYNRPKDWIQLMQLSSKIFDGKLFESQISSIITDDEYPQDK